MPEYIERKRAIVDACNSLELYPHEYAKLEDALNKIPAADVVPVVRCRECKYARESTLAFEFDGESPLCECEFMPLPHRWYEYCSWGERKECAER